MMGEQMDVQIRADGSSFEQSTYYQGYVFDMFRLHAILARPGPDYLAKLERMAEFLDAIAGPSRRLPLLGDDDGGQLPLGAMQRPSGRREAGIAALSRSRPGGDDLRPSACPGRRRALSARCIPATAIPTR